MLADTLARWRVSLGFVSGVLSLALAQPTSASVAVGMSVAAIGEALRVWAAGHLEKGREVTTSGPYRFLRHPLYTGSSIMAAGFAIACASLPVAGLSAAYVASTILTTARREERLLDDRFDGAYSRYRSGQMRESRRRFSWARFVRNREYRAAIGLVIVTGLLIARRFV